MGSENPDEDPTFRIIERIYPDKTEVLKGYPDEPLVVRQTWPDGRIESTRIVNPERSYQIPTFVFWDETVTPKQQGLIREAMDEMFDEIGFDKTQLNYFGNWHEEEYKDGQGNLIPHKSIEWQLQSKWDGTRQKVDADRVAYAMYSDPYQVDAPHWEVIFTNKDLCTPDTNFVIGVAQPDLGTVISLKRLEAVKDVGLRGETQKTEIFHEVGHVFGLPSGRRGGSNLEQSLGAHCKSPGCSMKQGLSVPNDWVNFTTERLKQGGKPFCN